MWASGGRGGEGVGHLGSAVGRVQCCGGGIPVSLALLGLRSMPGRKVALQGRRAEQKAL